MLELLSAAKVRSLDGTVDLASYTQGIWLIHNGYEPVLTITTGSNLLAQQLAFVNAMIDKLQGQRVFVMSTSNLLYAAAKRGLEEGLSGVFAADSVFMGGGGAKGVPRPRRVLWHALPNAAIPIITIIGLKLGDLVAGSIIVETVFAVPGVGRLLVNAVTSRDFALVQAILIMTSITMVLANLAVDAIYALIDPRMRAARSES